MNDGKRRIGIVSIEPQAFTNERTGVVTEMLKVTYLVKIDTDTERFIGNNILVSYVPTKDLEKLRKYVITLSSTAEIAERATSNGVKWVIKSINDVKLRD